MPALTVEATKFVAVSSSFIFVMRLNVEKNSALRLRMTIGYLSSRPTERSFPKTDHYTAGEHLRGGRTIRLSSAESTRAQTKEINDDV
jgi:hypothetical protein